MAKKSHGNTLWGQLLQDSRELAYQVWTKILRKSTEPARCQKGQHPYGSGRYPYQTPSQHRPCWSSLSPPLPPPSLQRQPFLQQHLPNSGVDSALYLPFHAPPLQKSVISSASSSYTSIATLSQYQSLWEVQLALQEIPDMMDENLLTPVEDPSRFRADPFQTLDSSWSKDDDDFFRSAPHKDQPPFLPLPLGTESPEHEANPGDEDDQGDDDKNEGEEEEELACGEDQQPPQCYLGNESLDGLLLRGAREPSEILFYPSPSLDSLPIKFKNSPLGLDDKSSFALCEYLHPQKLLTKAETPQEMFFAPGTFIQANAVTAAAASAAATSTLGDADAGDSIAYESLVADNVVAEEERGGIWKWDEQPQKYMMSATAIPFSAIEKEQEEDQQVDKYADRHDRKDSGFFMHDEEEGIFVQVSPRPKSRKYPMNLHAESDSSDWSSEEE